MISQFSSQTIVFIELKWLTFKFYGNYDLHNKVVKHLDLIFSLHRFHNNDLKDLFLLLLLKCFFIIIKYTFSNRLDFPFSKHVQFILKTENVLHFCSYQLLACLNTYFIYLHFSKCINFKAWLSSKSSFFFFYPIFSLNVIITS